MAARDPLNREHETDDRPRPGAGETLNSGPDGADALFPEDSRRRELGNEMGFFDHLEELRWRIIKALIALVVCGVGCGIFYRTITEEVLMRPAREAVPPVEIQNIEVMGQLTLAIQVCLFSGLILAIPFILWQFWGFIKPGLYKRERRYVGVIAVATIFCFLVGVSFAYFVTIPAALGFAAGFQVAEGIKNIIAIGSYFSFVLGFILACGLIFEMPMLSYALSRFGIVTPTFLKKYRRHAMVVLLIVAAIVTPTPDPINQLLLAGPLYILYEISIVVSRFAGRQRTEATLEQIAEEREG